MKQKGFTLIELMIVIAIIGILAVVAIPQYNKYTARVQVAEAFMLMAPVKTALILYYQTHGGFPTMADIDERHDALGIAERLDLGGDYVKQLMVFHTSGRIRVQFFSNTPVNDLIKGKIFEIQPTESSGVITSWTCFTNAPGSNWIDLEYISSCD